MNIKQLRKKAGLSQRSLAYLLNMEYHRQIVRWENGENEPGPEYTAKLIRIFASLEDAKHA